MGGYLTLEEAADRLGVEYKTLYRLVRSGELPAGKIGRVYRIREEDLEGYFEQQKEQVVAQARRSGLTALEGLVCGACGRGILSELSIGGRCDQTGKAICQACWSIRKIRRCAGESRADQPTADRGGRAPQVAPAAEAANRQAEETVQQAIERLRGEGKAVVTAADAKGAEQVFLRSFARRLEEVEELPDPLAARAIRLRQARVKHEIERAFKGDDRLPGNCVSRFTLKTGGWGKPAARLVLECRFLSRPEVIKARLYDAEPIEAAELTAILNALSDRAKKEDCFHLAAIGSPTGWSDDAAAMVAGRRGSRSYRDRRSAAVLWDLHADRALLDQADERLWAFLALAAPADYAAAVARCVQAVKDALVRRNSLSLKDATRLSKGHECWVRAAFEELKHTGEYATDQLPELGLVISRAAP